MNRPIWQRIGAVLCCLLFICCFGFRITVDAVLTELAIAGVVVASAALLASVAVVSMGSAGLSDPLIDAANQANTDAKNWTAQKIRQFMQTESEIEYGTFDAQVNALCNGMRCAKDGTIVVSRYYADWFSRFADWLIDNGDLILSSTDEGLNVTSGSISYINYPVTFFSSSTSSIVVNSSNTWHFGSNTDVYILYLVNSGVVRAYAVSATAFKYDVSYSSISRYSYDPTHIVYNSKDIYYSDYYASQYISLDGVFNVININPSSVVASDIYPLFYDMLYNATSTGATDGLDVWNDDTATDGLVLDPTALLGDAVNDLAGAVANVGDYIGTIADVIAGVGNPALPVVGVGDIPISIPADIVIPVTPAIPADIADSEPVTGEDAEEPYTGTGDYTLPLSDFFPFCIPFDIYKMLSLLSAAPVAPSVDYPFPLPGGGTYTIHIDLSQFDSVAQVLRTIETLAFCVGLGFATKKLLFGS